MPLQYSNLTGAHILNKSIFTIFIILSTRFEMKDRNYSPTAKSRNRLYTFEETKKMFKAYLEPKLQYLRHELQKSKMVIAHLNEKLNQNDLLLSKQAALIESMLRSEKKKPIPQESPSKDFRRDLYEKVAMKLRGIQEKVLTTFNVQRLQQKMDGQIDSLKNEVNLMVDKSKKKHNGYWFSIKKILNKVQEQVMGLEGKSSSVCEFAYAEKKRRLEECQIINQLITGRNTIKMLSDLKVSVNHLFENFNYVMKEQSAKKRDLSEINLSCFKENQFVYQKPSQHKNQDQLFDQIFSNLQKSSPHRYSSLSLFEEQPQIGSFDVSKDRNINDKSRDKQRLIEYAKAKNISFPLQVKPDQQKIYLKNSEGNYLFDSKGNMFKYNDFNIKALQREGVIRIIY